ncbi:sensor histidine kinase [Nocardiopsis potens]|uniref:sensor histidine kinase n=1 Tax=Nocardiopsis potens TaxID=1246458 RepID=UPI00034C7F00|nr:HAMP domain-containing sensor histidine kinase [Nocardiopsis potens]
MLRRLLAILVPLAFLLMASLAVPLAAVVAQQQTQEVYVDRLNDAGRFASLGATALVNGRDEALRVELQRYRELYGGHVAIVGTTGEPLLESGPGDASGAEHPSVQDEAVRRALAGFRPEPPTAVWPWDDADLVIAEPVGRDSMVEGAVVLSVPTGDLRSAILADWGLMALLGTVPLALLCAVAWPLSRWVLRPVHRLDEATAAIAGGDLSVRADDEGGPPELRRLAGSFNAMVDVVERALHRQRAFVSDASHQLRNPLASLRLAVENLQPYLDGPEAREIHGDAVEETKAMSRLLNSLLAATRLESFSRAEPVDLDELLATRLPRWRALAEGYGIEVENAVPEGLRVLAPPGGLGSVLDELMSNATRLSGASVIRLGAAADRPDGEGGEGPPMVVLHVADDGAGLTPEEREKALHRFWRGSGQQNTEGTGLGLSICADLVESAGGGLRLLPGLPDGAGGFGLDVAIRLPAAPGTA